MEQVNSGQLTPIKRPDYNNLMEKRIRSILMICTNYDKYSLEEDGQIEFQIYREYVDLNISNPPKFTWVDTTAHAEELLRKERAFDLVICMYNTADEGIFKLSRTLKGNGINVPVILLTNFSKEVFKRIDKEDKSCVDYIFSWNGNADLILAIIKLIEDNMNAEKDIFGCLFGDSMLADRHIHTSPFHSMIFRLICSLLRSASPVGT